MGLASGRIHMYWFQTMKIHVWFEKFKHTVNMGGKQIYVCFHNNKRTLHHLFFSHVNLLCLEVFQGNIPTSVSYLKITALLSQEDVDKGACLESRHPRSIFADSFDISASLGNKGGHSTN